MEATAIILAAGNSQRMKSNVSKVLHEVLGVPLIDYVLRATEQAGIARRVVVVGSRAEQMREHLQDSVDFAVQDPDKGWGTAKATEAAEAWIGEGPVFVLFADSPLVRPETLRRMREAIENGAAACAMTSVVGDPTGYGRIFRDAQGRVRAIVEHADATEEQRKIREVNSSVFCCKGADLRAALALIRNDNKKGEYYLSDAVKILASQGKRIETVEADEREGVGINDRAQLAEVARLMRERVNERHMREGVSLLAPEHTYIGPDVRIGRDSVIYPGCVLWGDTVVGEGVTLLPGCRLEDCRIGDGATLDNVVGVRASVGRGSRVGPFVQLRPQTAIGDGCRVGNFVEIKNSSVGDGAHVSHLTYVGDADVGKRVNLGCGVVFSNYDGKQKYRSRVADDAFIGGNANLISPVSVGEHAYIAAGTTVTRDVPDYAMAIGRSRAEIKEGWVRRRMEEGKL